MSKKILETSPAGAPKRASAIPRSKLAHQILSRLRDEIVKGKWAPGESLPSHVLSAEFGVSHIPIREAFLVLESEGFISLAPNRVAIVTEPSVDDTRDKLVLLHALEALAADLAARSATQADLDALKAIHATLDRRFEEHDLQAYHQINLQFHRHIVQAAQNQTLADFHQTLTRHLEWARVRSHIRAELLSDSRKQHQDIIDAILRRDGPAARAAMESHAQSFGHALLRGVEAHHT